MAGLVETLRNILMRERTIQRFERTVREAGIYLFDMFLKRDTEYVVKARVSRGKAPVDVVLEGPKGAAMNLHRTGRTMSFSVVPERDGFYQIRAVVREGTRKDAPLGIHVSLGCSCDLPPYILTQSVIPDYLASRPELRHRLTGSTEAARPESGMAGHRLHAG